MRLVADLRRFRNIDDAATYDIVQCLVCTIIIQYTKFISKERGNNMNSNKRFTPLDTWCKTHGEYEFLKFYNNGNNRFCASEIGFSANKFVNLKCDICSHTWPKSLNKATRKGAKRDCPACNNRILTDKNNLAKAYPELKFQWDTTKNIDTPENHKITSKEPRYWICHNRHRWEAVIRDRVKAAENIRVKGGILCPFCSNEKLSHTYNFGIVFSHISREWDYVNNKELTPEDCFPVGNNKVHWVCSFDTNHRWEDTIDNRTKLLRSCPICNKMWHMTYISRVVYYYLRQLFPDCLCEYPMSKYRLDIIMLNERIVIEHFGYTHQKPTSKERDEKRLRTLEEQGLRVIRLMEVKEKFKGFRQDGDIIFYHDKPPYNNLDNLIIYLVRYLESIINAPLFMDRPDHVRDFAKIDHLYFLERKKRSLAVLFPSIADEWSPNNPCRPDVVPAKVGDKYLWICPICKAEYSASVYNRTHLKTGHYECRRKAVNKKIKI